MRHIGLGLSLLLIVPLYLSVIGIFLAVLIQMKAYRWSMLSLNAWAEKEARTQFPCFVGKTPKYMDVRPAGFGRDLKAITASGIAYADGRIFILDEGLAAEIPWDCIRSWNWSVDGYSQTNLHGSHDVGTRVSVLASNEAARAMAHRASGFTITTSDIEKPEWRFQTSDTAVLKKWHEILTQLNEGRIARA